MGFGVRYSKALRLAIRHRSNIGGFGHNRKKRGVHPCPTREKKKNAVQCCPIKRSSEPICGVGGQVKVELW